MIVYHAYKKNEPCFYVGKTEHQLQHRRRQHENECKKPRSNSYFHRALLKYGADAFDWRVLEECKSVDELNKAEIRWIATVKECGHKLCNMTNGGEGGNTSAESYWAVHGIREDMKKKISESLKLYYQTHPHPSKGKTRTGKPHTQESKDKMRVAKNGHPVSEETREKLRQANLGKTLKPHVIEMLSKRFSGANNPSAKAVICITTGEVFAYAKLAAIKYNIDLSSIIKCCKGKAKTVKKMKFEYYPAGWELQPDL